MAGEDDDGIAPGLSQLSETEPFATHVELAKRWKQTPDDVDYVDQRLADASQFLREQCPSWRNIRPETLKRITCELAKDSLSQESQIEGAGFDTTGASNLSVSAGSFSQSMTFANPRGEFYLSKSQRRSLGLGRQRFWSIPQSREAGV